jgi:hypothetical protein
MLPVGARSMEFGCSEIMGIGLSDEGVVIGNNEVL